MSTLYMVATPIGNLEDITLRALSVLRQVDVIACEDTRHTKILLSKYDINKRLIACHAHNESVSAAGIVNLLESGDSVAYVSDAGTPGISDPGAKVVDMVTRAGFPVVPIPGVSAMATLVSVAGVIGKTYIFEGFLSPRKGRRKTRLTVLLERNEAFILYESPYRIVKLLEDIAALDPMRTLIIGREMTKTFEEFLRGTAGELIRILQERPAVKGECTLCICPKNLSEQEEENDEP